MSVRKHRIERLPAISRKAVFASISINPPAPSLLVGAGCTFSRNAHIGELPEYIHCRFGAVLLILNSFFRSYNKTFVVFRVMNAFNAKVHERHPFRTGHKAEPFRQSFRFLRRFGNKGLHPACAPVRTSKGTPVLCLGSTGSRREKPRNQAYQICRLAAFPMKHEHTSGQEVCFYRRIIRC